MFDDIIYYLGSNGPLILIVVTVGILYTKSNYLIVFLIGSVVNVLINYVLKGAIAQPRPNDHTTELERKYRKILNYDRYGMPSGHAQMVLFSTIFVYLATHDVRVFVCYFIMSLLTVYQRIHFEYHYLSQTIVGGILGGLIAWTFFSYGTMVLKGPLKGKKDDYYFG